MVDACEKKIKAAVQTEREISDRHCWDIHQRLRENESVCDDLRVQLGSLKRDQQRETCNQSTKHDSEKDHLNALLEKALDCARIEAIARRKSEKDAASAIALADSRLNKCKALTDQVNSLRDSVDSNRGEIEYLNDLIATHEVEKEDLQREMDEKLLEARVSR